MAKIGKTKRPEAERAAEHACREVLGCVATRRAIRARYFAVDFFACDIIGVRPDGSRVWVQVTAGQTPAVLVRRRKIEAYPWHPSDIVRVWQLVERVDIANPRKKEWFFRQWGYFLKELGASVDREWGDDLDPIPVRREWFKAVKE